MCEYPLSSTSSNRLWSTAGKISVPIKVVPISMRSKGSNGKIIVVSGLCCIDELCCRSCIFCGKEKWSRISTRKARMTFSLIESRSTLTTRMNSRTVDFRAECRMTSDGMAQICKCISKKPQDTPTVWWDE